GNDIFNQATLAATNMSVALGEDGTAAAMQLGKALNDPVAGVTALQRVGVKLTETQKEEIKQLVKHGDTLAAQKIILGELTTEFGGSAKAYGDSSAGAMAKIGNAVDEAEKGFARLLLPMAEAGLQLLPPLIDKVAEFSATVGGMISNFMSLPDVQGVIASISGIFGSLTGGPGDVSEYAGELSDNISLAISDAAPKLIDGFLGLVKKISAWLMNTGIPMFARAASQMFDTLAKVLPPAVQKLLAFIGEELPVIVGKFGEWGKAFVGWVGDRLPSLLASFGDALAAISAWLINTGLPELGRDLVKWGTAFVQWVGPQIPPLLKALGDMLAKVGAWLINPGLPTLVARMGDIGRAMVAAVMDFLVGRNGQTGLLQQFAGWFTGT
ncbi:MAG: hypothetical protein KGR26_15460, partial [Cyanobacteria bacterium REEB65]|nr:hypothetical protein [Cyanobacteria bacterium REEB65]